MERAKAAGHDIGPLECDITCKDGSARSVILYGIVLGDEVLATFTDITDRLRHEQILKRTYVHIPAYPDSESGFIRTRYRQHPDSNPEASGHLSGDLIVL